ncbi:bifunctional Helicase superfamily 1-2 [Babesia duncani]|uniref:Bifunctional Helicase superfamily 1-2 n=1 Tax=Babesia duncani TaxID=323732 RepID=A0AAD9UQI3_9APIC|nr:bifunctional Helicase superfamily 1-2 [Babesia duncani]
MEDPQNVESDSDASDTLVQLEEYKSRLTQSLNRKSKLVEPVHEHVPENVKTFEDLGVCKEICLVCKQIGWNYPTKIQQEAIPPALSGRDIIALAETGSGKTGAFTIPILQSLLNDCQRLYCLVLAPTRELCVQITEQFRALGASIALDVCLILGGLCMVSQTLQLAKKPHIIVGSPGRVADHLENTKGFTLSTVKYLVLDEADRILSMDFEDALDKIIHALPKQRNTFLFSATMTSKVSKLKKVSLDKPVEIKVNSKYDTVANLTQRYLFFPEKFKWTYLAYVLGRFDSKTTMIFCNQCIESELCTHFLRRLNFKTICLHGKMSQVQRLGALNQFKAGRHNILVTTDVGSRGLDIPCVDLVINFDVPCNSKDYIHRVGRTARAGRSGDALTFVTQNDIEAFQRIEHSMDTKLPEFKVCITLLHSQIVAGFR